MSLHAHLLSRGLNPALYHCALDEEANIATFYLTDLHGNITGYQQYRPGAPKTREGKGMSPKDLRYFTHVVPGRLAFFGAERFEWELNDLYIVEGIFDAVKLHSLGLNCFAVLGNDPKALAAMLYATGKRIIGVLDNDAAGGKLAKFCDDVFVCEAHDPGEMTPAELSRMLKL